MGIPTIEVKDASVNIGNLNPAFWQVFWNLGAIWSARRLDTIVITSGRDGRHSWTSLHHSDNAIDVRTKPHLRGGLNGVTKTGRQAVADALSNLLWPLFDVVLEDLGGPDEHLHIEYQPKGSAPQRTAHSRDQFPWIGTGTEQQHIA